MIRSLSMALGLALAAGPALAAAPAPVKVRLVPLSGPGGAGAAPWAAASLAAARRATLSTRLSAEARQVLVDEGAVVRKGQVLVRLAADDLRAQLAAAETAAASAAAQERRLRELAAQRAATPAELEGAQAEHARARAAVAGARAALDYAELRAPFDGTVQARRVSVGDLVGPGQPLLELEGGALEVQASLAEGEARGLRVGDRLRFESGGQRGEARVTALSAGGDPLTHRRFLRAAVVRGGEGLRSGSFARLELPAAAGAAGATWVPQSALVERGDLTGVFVVQDGRAVLRWVSPGERAGDHLAVRAGLRPEEAVIDAPGALEDGQPVEVARGN